VGARFEREVQATAALTHPNTVEVFDYGHAADGTFYYVMEYLPGLSLEELVKQHGPLPPGRAVHLLRQVCGALQEAHAAGLIHRDIKPGNIIVSERGSLCDVVKLLDFGLVQAHGLNPNGQQLTQEGAIAGTPAYMSPEQAGAQGELDGRSDIYSLGAVGYFLLTGQPPFVRNTAVQSLTAKLNDRDVFNSFLFGSIGDAKTGTPGTLNIQVNDSPGNDRVGLSVTGDVLKGSLLSYANNFGGNGGTTNSFCGVTVLGNIAGTANFDFTTGQSHGPSATAPPSLLCQISRPALPRHSDRSNRPFRPTGPWSRARSACRRQAAPCPKPSIPSKSSNAAPARRVAEAREAPLRVRFGLFGRFQVGERDRRRIGTRAGKRRPWPGIVRALLLRAVSSGTARSGWR
jgi:serine/threonine protein kinase